MSDPTPTEILQVRYTLGQFIPDGTSAERIPDQIVRFWWAEADGGDVLRTAILVAEALATTAADSFPFTADGQTIDVSKRIGNWYAIADRLRRRLAGRTTGVTMTRAAASAEDEWSG